MATPSVEATAVTVGTTAAPAPSLPTVDDPPEAVARKLRAYVESVAAADETGHCWYLSYGSNNNSKVLSGRRKVFPKESVPVKVPGWVMRYAARGAPFLEPAFGVLIPRPADAPESEPDCHGVCHRITSDEFLKIVATEGGGGQPSMGYSIVEVTAESTSGTPRTFHRVLSLGAGSKVWFNLLCSARYKELVVDGAKQGGVDPSYVSYLESIPHYDSSATWGRKIGRLISIAIMGTLVIPAFLLTSRLQLEPGGRGTYFIQKFWLLPIRTMTWVLHDYVLRHVLGSGTDNSGIPPLPPLPPPAPIAGIAGAEQHHDKPGDTILVAAIDESSDPRSSGA
ncbi:hypothetical protein DFJ74DRAFT_45284 [Hyaloraphidium curvatum]|nr:hypothetical protein DFJ74DRAFT_45284 [Hyaloraphidium curvatum]